MRKEITRRAFLQGATTTFLLAGTTPFHAFNSFSSSVTSTASGTKRKVLILGAGLAGLTAAYELDQAGFDVTVLEARSRPGGRVLTYRDPFADGLYAELGAEYVDASDDYMHRYCKEFGFNVMTAKLYDAIFVRGKKFKMDSFKHNKEKLPFEGTVGGILFGQEAEYTKRFVQMVKDPENLPEEILNLDKVSVAELLLQEGAPKDIVTLYKYLNATEETARPEEISALLMIKSHIKKTAFSEIQNEGRILGGNDQLPKAFARKLSDKILYNRPVRKIAHNKTSTEVWFEEGSQLPSLQAPFLVIAIPFTVLRNLEIRPEFSTEKMTCIRKLAYGQGMKIAMQFKSRFWDESDSLGQRVFTDTKLRRIYHMSIDQPGPRGILMSFTSAEDAENLGRLSEQDRLRVALDETTKIWSEAPKEWEGGVSKYWNEDPWAKGSYSFTSVGQEIDFLDFARKPEGQVHFAGEHTSRFRASMNGAIESGLRACEEVKKAAG